jgi:type II secretory pathway predicted ATPase ExeA
MYKKHFGLTDLPFSIAPDPRFLYMSGQHREALAHLIYGVTTEGGFVLLTGEVGTGKTTICRCLLEQVPEATDIAFILNPKVTVEELLASICDEIGVRYPEGTKSNKVFIDLINDYLLDAHARGRKTVLVIEEAQNLSPDVLEQVRLLTNLETADRKLLQIIMLGQPELKDILARPELRQLSQRITARYHLGPLSRQDISAYVSHRLTVAGGKKRLFSPSSIRLLYRLSGGVPRLINLLCDRALLGAYVQEKSRVDRSTLRKAAGEVLGKPPEFGKWLTLRRAFVMLLVLICGAVLAILYKEGGLNVPVTIASKPAQEIQLPPVPKPDTLQRQEILLPSGPKPDTLQWLRLALQEQKPAAAVPAVSAPEKQMEEELQQQAGASLKGEKSVAPSVKSTDGNPPVAAPEKRAAKKAAAGRKDTGKPVSAQKSVEQKSPEPLKPVVRQEPAPQMQREAKAELSELPKNEAILKEEVDKFMKRYIRAYTQNDLEGFMALFSRAAVENNTMGYQDIRNAYSEIFREKINIYSVQNMDIRTDGRTAAVSGIYVVNRYISAEDRWVKHSGKISWKLARENGQLKIVSTTYDK